MAKKTVDAVDLRPGDRIKFRPGVEATVTKPSERQAHNTVQVHTDKGSALTTRPCPVDVVS